MITNIIIGIIVFHLIIGFGWLIYKLSPRSGDSLLDNYEEESKDHID